MDDRQFDVIARAQGAAGSRRQGFKLFVGGVLGGLLGHLGRTAAAACRTFNQSCDNQRPCCGDHGIRCLDGRCKCRNGRAHCVAGPGCQDLKRDPDHCGKCKKKCPASKPCCFKGACRAACGEPGTCCADCFVTITGDDVPPDPESAICCQAVNGEICSSKPGGGDDRCCYPDEECLKGRCCRDGEYGESNCAGTCCREAACCNGTTCCKKGKVCATKAVDDPTESCVSANRSCEGNEDCFPGEACHGGRCCSGARLCQEDEDNSLCCKAAEYCEFPGTPLAGCVPVHTSDSTYRTHRVRP